MKNFVADELTIEIVPPHGPRIRLDWIGKSSARQPHSLLKTFFAHVKATALSNNQEIEMHFERLHHFNSSTVTTLIHFIQELRTERIPLIFVFDASLKWQKLSFDALRIFELPDGLLTIREVAEASQPSMTL